MAGEPKPEKQDFNHEQQAASGLVRKGLQALFQWAPLGGSGIILINFVLNQEWLFALITFPLTLVTIFWASFTARSYQFADTLGTEAGNLLEVWIRAMLQGMRWQLTNVEAKYLRCQGNEVSQSRIEGYSTFKPLLKDVFVPLELSSNFWRSTAGDAIPLPRGYRSSDETAIAEFLARADEYRIWDVLQRSVADHNCRSLVIQAWGGFGKTTLLHHITCIYCNGLHHKAPFKVPKLLSVLIHFRQWRDTLLSEKPDLPTFIEQFHLLSLPEGKTLLPELPPNWASHWLHQKSGMLVMFDGFDEVKETDRQALSEWIGQQVHNYPRATFILTSRPTAYRLHFAPEAKFNLSVLSRQTAEC